jgi:hypothetical protein
MKGKAIKQMSSAAVACKESGVAYGSCIMRYSQAISKDACKAEFEVFRRCFMTSVCRCRTVCMFGLLMARWGGGSRNQLEFLCV